MSKLDYTAQDLTRRIFLFKVQETLDEELNRLDRLVLLRSVWAHVEVKSTSDVQTIAGEKPQIKYQFVCRFADDIINEVKKVGYNGKILAINEPIYEVDRKYIVINAVETYGKRMGYFVDLP